MVHELPALTFEGGQGLVRPVGDGRDPRRSEGPENGEVLG